MTNARKEPAVGNAAIDLKQIYSHPLDPKERILDELTDYVYTATEETYDGNKLQSLLDALNEVDPLPEISDTEESLKAFHEKYASLFEETDSPKDEEFTDAAQSAAMISASPAKKRSRRSVFKLIAIAAVLVLLLGSVVASAFNLGNLFDVFTHWTTDRFHAGSDDVPSAAISAMPLAKGEEASYDSPQEAMNAFGLNVPLVPQWIPPRYTLEAITAYHKTGGLNIYIDYTSDDGFLQLRYRQVTVDSKGIELDTKQLAVRSFSGLDHYIMPDMDRCKAYWRNGELDCSISGTVSKDEMLQIIESIYE